MSELRRDLVSGEWVIMAPERGRRPHLIVPPKRPRRFGFKKNCPFEEKNLKLGEGWPPIAQFPRAGEWDIAIVPNKYPAVAHHQECTSLTRRGIYPVMAGIGHHDIVITRDHTKGFADLPASHAVRLFLMLQERYRAMVQDICLTYASSFFNWGPSAGASVPHPHYQMLTLPIIPPEVAFSLRGSEAYYREHKRCAHCDIIRFERKEKKRILLEDAHSVAITPFVSREPFVVEIFPKRHLPYFERAAPSVIRSTAQMLQHILRKVRKNLNDVDVNFFIHSAPLARQSRYGHYHWHIEVIPVISVQAGFELSTHLEINVVDPDKAARILRK